KGSETGELKLFDLATGSSIDLAGHTVIVLDLAWSRDGLLLASGALDGTARLWDAKTLAEVGTLRSLGCAFDRIAFSPDSRLLASVGYDRAVRLWDVRSRSGLRTLGKIEDRPYCLSFSPKGTWIFVGEKDRLFAWPTVEGDKPVEEPVAGPRPNPG